MPEHTLGSESIHTVWDATLSPALRVAPGDTVEIRILDASFGRVARQVHEGSLEAPEALRARIAAGTYDERPSTGGVRGHPLTGPIFVEGVRPGDTLRVEVLDVRTADWGWNGCRPHGIGLLDAEVEAPYTHFWDLAGGTHTDFLGVARLPLAPFPGVIGVAPGAPGPHVTSPPRQVGGNMDVRQITAGSMLFLPVEVEGALLSVGDVHAAQGDGEVSGTGIETDGAVTVRVEVLKGKSIRTPQVMATPEPTDLWSRGAFLTTGHAPDLMEAARIALRGMLEHLGEQHGLSFTQAYVLASACVDLRISQVVDAPNWTVSALLPNRIFT